ncbi:hypothetical protein K438DRAFT_1991564 [Mycena galopus ATCC 62051]|nr:hypothetical protein K438DRAFT_1991564 [Mycena galopus ATCC 62051]
MQKSDAVFCCAKYQPYSLLRQRFWRQYLKQYDTDDTKAIYEAAARRTAYGEPVQELARVRAVEGELLRGISRKVAKITDAGLSDYELRDQQEATLGGANYWWNVARLDDDGKAPGTKEYGAYTIPSLPFFLFPPHAQPLRAEGGSLLARLLIIVGPPYAAQIIRPPCASSSSRKKDEEEDIVTLKFLQQVPESRPGVLRRGSRQTMSPTQPRRRMRQVLVKAKIGDADKQEGEEDKEMENDEVGSSDD